MNQITRITDDAVHLWPDGTWCYHSELHEYAHMSDDFELLVLDSDEYEEFFS